RSQDTDLSDGIHARVHDKRVLPARRVDSVVKHVRAIDLKDVVFHAATVHAVFSATSDTRFALVLTRLVRDALHQGDQLVGSAPDEMGGLDLGLAQSSGDFSVCGLNVT